MRLKLIACKAMFREISYLAATCRNFIDVTYLQQGLHDVPKMLNQVLQDEIDRVESGEDLYTYNAKFTTQKFDAILLGYGLCSNGAVGLHAKHHPLVIPKVHDCISLLLGSREKYNEEFSAHCGTYWYSASWIENGGTPSEQSEREMKKKYAEKYGEENADFLYEAEVLHNYNRCAYIHWPELAFPEYERYTEDAAAYLGWDYAKVDGTSGMLRDFLDGKWDERFLYVKPGQKVAPDYDTDDVLCVEDL